MNDTLQTTLNDLIQSGTGTNPAMNTLINDYTTYHVVFVIAGVLLVVLFVLLSIFFWSKWKRSPKTDKSKWAVEKKVYFSFGVLSIVVGLTMALITVANVTNALNPLHGFSLLPASIETPTVGTQKDQLYRAFNTWLQSGSAEMPPIIQSKIHERTAFHTTKAIICALLLVLFVVLSRFIWSQLFQRMSVIRSKWRLKEIALLISGSVVVALCLLMMIIVVANTQAAFGPITLTLLYG
jgi:hypothetical protein